MNKQVIPQVPTFLLKATIVAIGLLILTLCIYLFFVGILSDHTGYYLPILLGMYATALPFFYALYQAFKLLTYIDKNSAFTDNSVVALRNIKYAACIISALYGLGMPYIYHAAQMDDAPGIVLIGLIIGFASFVIAVAAALFQRLFQNAVIIKKENDLTV